jgi:hypothetical protein
MRRRLGGVEGNERLTGATAVLLTGLLAVEGITLLFLGRLLSVHVFVGMLLIPPVLLKLGATGYRFMRYYQRRREYTVKGPPPPVMRFLVAPALVLSTIGVLGTGVLMIAFGRRGIIVGLHKASFVVWAFAFGIHFLVYLRRLPRLVRPDRQTRGSVLRAGAIGASLVAGIALASVTFPLAKPWLHHFRRDRGEDQAAAAIRTVAAPEATRTSVKSRPPRLRRAPPSPASRALGLPPVGPGPVPGYVLIADRNANKLLVVSPLKRIVWQYPRPRDLRPGQSFSDPDDAFFTPDYRRIVTNEEFNDQVAQIDLRTHRLVWSYGRAGVGGSSSGELSNPDDAYVWPNRTITVADIKNCRVLRLSPAHHIIAQIGSGGSCAHNPPRTLSSPNGATPLPDGGILVTEIGGWVDRFNRHGYLVFAVRTPTTYPSDAQLLPNGNILVAGFNTPGRVDIITPAGRIVWTYGPSSGPGTLDRPSLAVRWPNGMIAVTDDWHHRIVVIDPRTKRIVWEYGHLGIPSTANGYLDKPDGLDLLPAAVAPAAPHRSLPALQVTTVGRLPTPTSRIAAEALPDGRVLAAGGLVGGTSSSRILLGPPGRLRVAGRLPAPTHDAALAGGYLFGGGEEVSTDAVVRIDPRTGAARRAGTLGEPLSDLGAVTLGNRMYLVGGYTGSRFATAVLRFRPGSAPVVVARLSAGLRYAGVAAFGDRIYVAGGVTPSGESDAVLAVDPLRHSVRTVAHLPAPVAHAPLAPLNGSLYLIGGTDTAGAPLRTILRIHSGAVSVTGSLPTPLADAAAVTLGGRIVVLGGAGTAPSSTILALR